jgi:phage FluMu protein Com
MREIRCKKCNRLLFKIYDSKKDGVFDVIEIKCPRSRSNDKHFQKIILNPGSKDFKVSLDT